jgi:hypothetical protein
MRNLALPSEKAATMTAMPNRSAPWDGREPITEALLRRSLRDVFQVAVDRGNRGEAVQILRDVGADEETAERMIDVLIPLSESEA